MLTSDILSKLATTKSMAKFNGLPAALIRNREREKERKREEQKIRVKRVKERVNFIRSE